jgi:hypothetical protein
MAWEPTPQRSGENEANHGFEDTWWHESPLIKGGEKEVGHGSGDMWWHNNPPHKRTKIRKLTMGPGDWWQYKSQSWI